MLADQKQRDILYNLHPCDSGCILTCNLSLHSGRIQALECYEELFFSPIDVKHCNISAGAIGELPHMCQKRTQDEPVVLAVKTNINSTYLGMCVPQQGLCWSEYWEC